MKKIICYLCVFLLTFLLIGCGTGNGKGGEKNVSKLTLNQSESSRKTKELARLQKADFLQAVTEIQTSYIYLEEKTGLTRDSFIRREMQYIDSVDWGKNKSVLVEEIRKLRGNFGDGHFNWSLSDSYEPFQGIKYLGFTPTIDEKNRVLVGKIYEGIIGKEIRVGDELKTWDGLPIHQVLKSLGKEIPQSTELGTQEKACRFLTMEMGRMPLRASLQDVKISFQRPNGEIYEKTLSWQNCSATTDIAEMEQDVAGKTVLFTKGILPSLETIPKDAEFPHPRLVLYFLQVRGKTFGVLHPRSFSEFTMEDLNKVMKVVKKKKPTALIIDLKDTAGGYFDQVLFLSHSLNIEKPFTFTMSEIVKETKEKQVQKMDFSELEASIKKPVTWNGKIYIRINPITVSGGDYFTRWMKRNHRGKIFGMNTAGAGAGTDTITLRNSGIELDIPRRDRRITGDSETIEGKGTAPDELFSGEIYDYLMQE